MSCKICGDEEGLRCERFWSPDDGWMWGRLCFACREDFGNRKPKTGDFAVFACAERRGISEQKALRILKGQIAPETAEQEDQYIDTFMG